MGIRILVRTKGGEERPMEFDRLKITIGADALCDLTVEGDRVDREQAVLVRRGDLYEIFDIGERGGVLVNGQPATHSAVQPGDEIWVGATVFSLASSKTGVSFTPQGAATVRASVPAAPASAPDLPAPAKLKTMPEAQRRLALFNEVGRLINSIGRTENIFEAILDTVFSTVPVRRAFLALREATGGLDVTAHRNREADARGGVIEVSQTLVRRVLDAGQAVLTSDAEGDPDFSAARSIHRLRIKAAVCVPLTVEGKVIGLLYGDNREQPGALTQEDLAFLSALATVAAVAVEKGRLLEQYDAKLKIEQALAIARSIHRNFLPSAPPTTPGLDVWGRSDSCDETGGDYFDYFQLPNGRLGVVIGDVTGHGIGPALLMATVRAALRALLESDAPLDQLLFRLNNLIRGDIRDGRFVTLFFAAFDPIQGSMAHAGAGHTPPIWYRARDGKTVEVPSGGPPLGIIQGMRFPRGTDLPIGQGDVVLLTTDGIMEAANEAGEMFGLNRLRTLLTENAGRSAAEIGEAITSAVEAFLGKRPLHDDATLVVVKRR
ncbi:MAG: SpoIIE family protein phosphatase [Planctomycetaceae bacterium]